MPKRNWARYFGNKIKCDRESNASKNSIDSPVDKDNEEEMSNEDDYSELSENNDDSSSESSRSSTNNNEIGDVCFVDDQHVDYDDNILNIEGPEIELYQSELDDTEDSHQEDVDEGINRRNWEQELKEDQYWANHHSGESYLADTSDGSSSDESD